jgi:hypothetical protein
MDHYQMTYKDGGLTGLFIGGTLFFFLKFTTPVTSGAATAASISLFVVGYIFILGIIFGLIGFFRRQAIINTTTDGFIFGISSAFEVPLVFLTLIQGQWPSP